MIRLALFLCVFLGGCASTPGGYVQVPVIPAWEFADDSAVVSDMELYNSVLYDLTLAPIFGGIDSTDNSFITLDHAWLEKLCAWSGEFRKSARINFVTDSFDCDKFALGFCFAANMAAGHEGIKHQPLLFRISVEQVKPFGGVPAGGRHALAVGRTQKGLYVIEPQSGVMVPLAQYPNRDQIYKIRIGG